MKKIKLAAPIKKYPRGIGYCAAYYYLQDFTDKEVKREFFKRTTSSKRKRMRDQEYWEVRTWDDFCHIWLCNLLRDVMTDDELSAITEIVIKDEKVDIQTLEHESGITLREIQ